MAYRLLLVQFVDDPAYFEMPLIPTMDFVLNPAVTPRPVPAPLEIVDERRIPFVRMEIAVTPDAAPFKHSRVWDGGASRTCRTCP